MRAIRSRVLLFAAMAMTAVSARAAWPEDRPIEVYVGFAAGGGTDLLDQTVFHHGNTIRHGQRLTLVMGDENNPHIAFGL